ncbi:MAG: hypothetical protein ACXVLQ_12720 [Bacteriovorax sp.]
MIRLFLLAIIFSLISCAQLVRNPASQSDLKHIVFDIDWTITSEVDVNFEGPRTIDVEGKKYFVHDGIEDLIEELLKRKDVKISFFSGGGLSRNHELLSKIKLRDGRSLEEIAYKILNRDDLTINPGALETDRFFVRFKKDLTKVSPDLENLVMIDDTEHFVLDPLQEEHVLTLGKTFKHFDHFEDAKEATGPYVPRSIGEWGLARKKLYVVGGALDTALKECDENGTSLSKALRNEAQKLNFENGEWNEYSLKMYRISQRFSTINVDRSSSCFELVAPLLLR